MEVSRGDLGVEYDFVDALQFTDRESGCAESCS